MPREVLSFCRICPGACGVHLSLDDAGRLTESGRRRIIR